MARVHYNTRAPRVLDLALDLGRAEVTLAGFAARVALDCDRVGLDAHDLPERSTSTCTAAACRPAICAVRFTLDAHRVNSARLHDLPGATSMPATGGPCEWRA